MLTQPWASPVPVMVESIPPNLTPVNFFWDSRTGVHCCHVKPQGADWCPRRRFFRRPSIISTGACPDAVGSALDQHAFPFFHFYQVLNGSVVWVSTDRSYIISFSWLNSIIKHFQLDCSWRPGMWDFIVPFPSCWLSSAETTRFNWSLVFILACFTCAAILYLQLVDSRNRSRWCFWMCWCVCSSSPTDTLARTRLAKELNVRMKQCIDSQ